MHWVYGNWPSGVPSCGACVHTELWSAGFALHGGYSCAPCYPLTTVGFVNGPFTRQLSTCSLAADLFTESQCDAQLFGTLSLLMWHNYEGGLASLTEVLAMPLDVLHSAFSLYKFWERILIMISRGKRVWYCTATHSLCSSFKDNNSPQALSSSVVLGASGSLCNILQRIDASWVVTVLCILAALDGLIWESKVFSFQAKHYLSWNYHQVMWKSFSDSQWID